MIAVLRRQVKQFVQALTAPLASLAWRASSGPRLMVLMYHRVLPATHPDRSHEQPGMYVSPETLALHLGILKKHFDLVHLDDWARQAAGGLPLPRLACALTFDDGWRDNFEYAFPILQAHGVPATIYLLADLVGTQYSFWPNRLARLLGRPRAGDAGADWPDWLEQERALGPLTMTRIDAVIARCKSQYTDAQMVHMLNATGAVGAAPGAAASRDLMNWDEIRLMAAGGVRFGSHTRRHTRLDERATRVVLEDEIRDSRVLIERELQAPVSSFCYPNGDHCPAAVDLVRASYATAVTTRRGWNSTATDTYLLNRVGMHEDVSNTAAAFLSRLLLTAA